MNPKSTKSERAARASHRGARPPGRAVPHASRSAKRQARRRSEAEIQRASERDRDSPELTDAELAAPKPAGEGLPGERREGLRKRRPGQRGRQKAPTKKMVTLRLDRDVLEHFRASGPGWQRRLNDALRKELSGR
jgi:uncharacterized protein (DUF4415 family)